MIDSSNTKEYIEMTLKGKNIETADINTTDERHDYVLNFYKKGEQI